MAYDEGLEERLENMLNAKGIPYDARKMMGGLVFMVDEKMCLGIHKDLLMARLDPDNYENALKRPGAQAMNFTGRPMKGFVFVEPEGIDLEDNLEHFVDLALKFNPKAKRSKKRKEIKGS